MTALMIRRAAVKAVEQWLSRLCTFAATDCAHVTRTNKCSAFVSCFGKAVAAHTCHVIILSAGEQATLLAGVTRVATDEAGARVVHALRAVVVFGVLRREVETAAVKGAMTRPQTVEQICVLATNVADIVRL